MGVPIRGVENVRAFQRTNVTVRKNEVSAKGWFDYTTIENQTYDMTPALGVLVSSRLS